jgi:hypothetical protein
MLRRVALVRTDISEELSASIRVTRIGELRTTLDLTSNRRSARPCSVSPLYESVYVVCSVDNIGEEKSIVYCV